ncbi:MAG: low molecular weight phosphatase family protein [Rhodococcus sp.]|nr:low molecular weight phosphatase family protein [Rhodococcus sp. (in: high G+C Gram-positive bacteria)]
MHVLFLCSGNVCRSPIAERLTRAFAVEHGRTDLTAESAGVRALVGFPIEPFAADVIEGLGASASLFKARRLRPDMIEHADLVLGMTERIRDHAADLVPDAAHRVFTLREASSLAARADATTVAGLAGARGRYSIDHEDIADPVGLKSEAVARVGDRIADALLPLLHALAQSEPLHTPVVEPRLTRSFVSGGCYASAGNR